MTNALRKTGIEMVGDVPWGTHFCHFYETRKDMLDILIPYFKAGLENKEFCMWIVFDPPPTKQEARNALIGAFPEADRHLAAGDIEIIQHSEWYLKDDKFDVRRVVDAWKEKLDKALDRGYHGMRVNGIEAWLTDKDWKAFAEYEEELNRLIAGQRMIVLCTYPLAGTSADRIFDVARTHQLTIAMRNGNWDVLETPKLKQAKTELKQITEELEQRIAERTAELGAANEHLRREMAERKRTEEALQKSEEELRTLFAAMTDVVLVLDADGRYVKIAPTNPLNLYQPSEELIGKKIDEILPAEDSDKILHQIKRSLESRQSINFEYKLNIGEREVWFDGTVSPLTENTVFWFARDITERKRSQEAQKKLEEQFLRAQKLESIGRLAGGVAHDFNNMLGVIIGYTEQALTELAPQNPAQKDLQEVMSAAKRSVDLVRQLLAFARRQVVSPVVLDMNDTLESMLKMLRRLIGEDIDLVWMPGHKLWKVMIDPSQVDQLLANLTVNARDAIAGVGKVIIHTDNVTLDEAFCAEHADCVPGDYVLLSISDSGTGMDEKTLANIFEPFFTTKEAGNGTGLGLSTVYGIVKQNDGFIDVDSEPGRGTIFRIYIPRFEAAFVESPVEQTATIPRGGTETILIVEDEESVLKLGRMLLERLGYTVLAARKPSEAIRLAEAHAGTIDLLITDVVMPEMNGRELIDRIAAVCPRIKSLYMSGYTADVIAHRGVLRQGVHFIQKPFTKTVLAQKVREALEQESGTDEKEK
jgi:PAS domain S-box-containing protein